MFHNENPSSTAWRWFNLCKHLLILSFVRNCCPWKEPGVFTDVPETFCLKGPIFCRFDAFSYWYWNTLTVVLFDGSDCGVDFQAVDPVRGQLETKSGPAQTSTLYSLFSQSFLPKGFLVFKSSSVEKHRVIKALESRDLYSSTRSTKPELSCITTNISPTVHLLFCRLWACSVKGHI